MRRRNLRIFLGICILVLVSGLIIGNQDIDLPGESLDRGGSGPLGLVLGLDLRGGAHLVYEAQNPARISATFTEPLSEDEVRKALRSMGHPRSTLTSFASERFALDVPELEPAQVNDYLSEMEAELADLEKVEQRREQRTRIELAVKNGPTEESITEALSAQELSDVTLIGVSPNVFLLENVPELDELKLIALRENLDEIYPLGQLQLAPPGEGEKLQRAIIFFEPLPTVADVQGALSNLGHTGSSVEKTMDGKNFYATVKVLGDEEREDLKTNLQGELTGVESIRTRLIETSLLDLIFTIGQDRGEMESALMALTNLGFPRGQATDFKSQSYSILIPDLEEGEDSATDETDFQKLLVQNTAPLQSFSLIREETTDERMEGVIDTIERRVNAFGITEPSVQRFGEKRVLVQLPGASDANIEVTFIRPVSEFSLKEVLDAFDFMKVEITKLDIPNIANSFNVTIPDLPVEDIQEVQEHLAVAIGPMRDFMSSESGGQFQVTFESPVAFTELKDALGEMGYTNPEPIIVLGTGSTFRIRTPMLGAEDQLRLRNKMESSLGFILAYNVTGGVEEAKRLIGATARLELKERTCLDGPCGNATQFSDSDAVGRSGEALTGDNLNRAYAGTHPTTGLPIVNFVFDGDGTRIFRDLTTRIAGDPNRCVAHVLDGEDLICPVVQRPIVSGSGFVEGPDFTFDRVRGLSIQLESGSLPISLELVRESTVDALLGDESLKASLKAGILGLGLVMLFMIMYYRMPGIVAAVALVIYAVVILAVFKMIPVTLTLSGLAGVILSIGMAVDANILIFERLKEELRAGRSLLSAMEIGFRRAWPAIRDSNISTFITCGILFFFGRELGEPRITGFAITLAIGVGLSMFSALMISRNLLQLLSFTGLGRNLHLFSPEGDRRSSEVLGGEK
ncbi:protein translocase subunit SecD [SAR202 cluster bacterium AD-804-J14_MRT_500m]|nr:protein translocase subunit SecD [SAR202 cluster bacterium AD-804-J14_MRT_500m]